jgi:predicted HicB family RNase H-like nuclease
MKQVTCGMTIRLPLAEYKKAKAAADKQGITLTMWVRNAMAAALKN